MSLVLLSHPLASFCHKVLIALYENGTPFIAETIDFADPGSAAPLLERWPVGKIPILVDGERTVAETSIIIDYLQSHYPGTVRLLPDAAEAALDTRLWDRFFDLYVSVPMQKIVGDRLRPEDARDPYGIAEARASLDTAYAMIDKQLSSGPWALGESFTMADCSAAPALFYAAIVHPFADGQHNLAAYRARLLARPSIARTYEEARPYFQFFPYADAMTDSERYG